MAAEEAYPPIVSKFSDRVYSAPWWGPLGDCSLNWNFVALTPYFPNVVCQ